MQRIRAAVAQDEMGLPRPGPDTDWLCVWPLQGAGAHLQQDYRDQQGANEAYAALLTVRRGAAYDPTQEVWRLEFGLSRDGAKGFKLYVRPELDDDEADLEAEELEHIGTLPRFFARMDEVFTYFMHHSGAQTTMCGVVVMSHFNDGPPPG